MASHAATALAENLEYDVAIPEGWVLVSYRILESNLQNGINIQLGGGFYNVNEARSRIGVHAHLIPSAGHTRTRWIAQGGWEGVIDDVAVRDVTEIQSRPADVYILAGQSNMAGGSAVPVDPLLDDVHPLISYLAGTTATHLGGKAGEMRPAVDPLQHYGGTVLGVGPGMTAARGILATLAPGCRIALVAAAKGGTSLTGEGADWEPGAGTAYLNAVAQVQLALTLLPAGSAIRGLFWSQGESDNGPNVEATYPPAFQAMLAAFRTDLGLPDLSAVILGPTPEGDPEGRLSAAQAALDETSGSGFATPGVRFVAGPAGMTVPGDDIHFSAAGNRQRGADAAVAMAALIA
ncbi:sialate O-acetylesterase [Meridianimarinicoccus sp. RP-17]|uniref:sialate O-acetylesterase n=1 Tax=Meridianimarinicoccus zhengii TaxID=2056810 RepID=UPI0022A6F8B2|nr:sialate O-acetylesterase [Phycocomes zhengii]